MVFLISLRSQLHKNLSFRTIHNCLKKNYLLIFILITVVCLDGLFARTEAQSGNNLRHRTNAGAASSGQVYPQFRSPNGVIRWISDQMPLKVYVSPGISIDGVINEHLGAPEINVDNINSWPDLVANLVESPDALLRFPKADGFIPQHYDAAIEGINLWKAFERDGLFSFQFTDDPSDADIYIFWTNHFVNKLGLALFANDIRGYTAKRSFSYRLIQEGKHADFKPVVSLLRTTDTNGNPMPIQKMRAAAAHEFGHALGIEGHSTNANDLMSVYYGHGIVSNNDAATIRYLYHLTPDLIP